MVFATVCFSKRMKIIFILVGLSFVVWNPRYSLSTVAKKMYFFDQSETYQSSPNLLVTSSNGRKELMDRSKFNY